jgi:glycine C-acetyltransferase
MSSRERFVEHLGQEISNLRSEGLYKAERTIVSRQGAQVELADGRNVINLCANNYLGLAGDRAISDAAREALDRYGFGMSSVRFICGTHEIHRELERRLAAFLGTEDAILYSSCFDANTGLFETLLDERDAVISDALNHASIIDGIRLCKARRLRYANSDMAELEARLQEAADCRFRLIATDGVFSMDGLIANLPAICELAERHDAMVMVDDSHAVGFLGDSGRGTHEHHGVMTRVDLITGTLGKALGGASGGYTAGPAVVVDWLRQRSRPYLFSNTLAPVIAATTLTVLDFVERTPELRQRLWSNTRRFHGELSEAGFELPPLQHPIIPVMLGDARLAGRMAERLLSSGVYVIGFSYPVVPRDRARIRTQMSAALTEQQIDRSVTAFVEAGRELGVVQAV